MSLTPQELEAIFEGKPFDRATMRNSAFLLAIGVGLLCLAAWLAYHVR
jgi:hypothetical protein